MEDLGWGKTVDRETASLTRFGGDELEDRTQEIVGGRLGLRALPEVPNPRATGRSRPQRGAGSRLRSRRFARLSWLDRPPGGVPENRGVPGSSPGLAIGK
jgi:hypothetical protein